jgi:hypothetical protein
MKTILIHSLLVALLFTTQSCEKSQNSVEPEACRGLPNTSAPAGLSGNWASGYSSYTQVVDVYSGKYLGNAWQSFTTPLRHNIRKQPSKPLVQ